MEDIDRDREILAAEKLDFKVPDCAKSFRIEYCGNCDHGYITESDGSKRECSCVLKARAIHRLTPTYASAKFVRTLQTEKWEHRNVLVEDCTLETFKTIFKTFFLNTGIKYRHETYSSFDIFQSYVGNSEIKMEHLRDVELLNICCISDAKYSNFGDVLTTLIKSRTLKGRYTWLYSPVPVKSQDFMDIYGTELTSYIKEDRESLFIRAKI